MIRIPTDRTSRIGLILAILVIAGFADWFLFAGLPTHKEQAASVLLLAGSLLVTGPTSEAMVFHLLRTLLAIAAIACAALSVALFVRSSDNAAARTVAWLLAGYAAWSLAIHVLQIDGRYAGLRLPPLVVTWLSLMALGWLAALAARFLAIFPRPVDGESVLATFWAHRRRRRRSGRLGTLVNFLDDPDARSVIWLPWHRRLVDGSMVWRVPAVLGGAFLGLGLLERATSWSGWGGIGALVVFLSIAWYFLFGLPFAFASTTHLSRNGTDAERARVRWLRALLLAQAAILVLVTLGMVVQAAFLRGAANLPLAGLLLLFIALLPTLFVLSLAFTVLYGGALDPRVAVTRVTVWSFMGFAITVGFLLLERYVAVRIASGLSLPPDSGAVIAGGIVAATFVPARRVTERFVTRLADRYLPLAMVADGERAQRTVLITDLSGYTALSATDEPAALLQGALLKRQGERIAAAHGGRLVKSMGDAVMLTFAEDANAVRAAADLHRAWAGAARLVGLDPLPLHSALHRGEIVESRDGDIYGQTVNVTARLVDAAAKHEIVASAAVGAGDAGLDWVDLGTRTFKNVPVPVAVRKALPVAAPG